MKKFLIYFFILIFISALLTLIYCLLDFKLTGWFAQDMQFMVIPGLICIAVTARLFQKGSVTSNTFTHLNSSSFEEHQQTVINNDTKFNSRIPIMLAFLSVGVIQLILGFTLFNN